MEIKEVKSNLDIGKPIKERMDIFLEDVNKNIPCRNGFIYALCGSGGSGKSSLLLNMFKSLKYYRKKFDNIFSLHQCHPSYQCRSIRLQSTPKSIMN